jgi:polyhydroxybutyrate depolymerase
MIEIYSGMDKKSDEANFIVVYPNGFAMRVGGPQALVFNAWNSPLSQTLPHPPPDDVKFAGKLIDDLATVVNVDRKRVFAAGMSNGGMMCYLLAGELSDRIAAIASIAGPQVVADARPGRPVPVLHFHGDADKVVPFAGPADGVEKLMQFRSVDETIKIWTKLDGCPDDPKVTEIADSAKDGTTITKKVFGPGKDDSEVVLYVIHGGGHTWPGRPGPDAIIGKSTKNLSANDVMWDFFLKHPMK